MRFPAVSRIHIRHRARSSALRHHRVRFSQQRFAHHSHRSALPERFNRCAQARSPGANHQHIVFVRFEPVAQKILTSWIAPEATSRTYRSANPTEITLIHANHMCPSFKIVSHCHALYLGFPNVAHEKQSTFPPAKGLSEWQDNE